MNKNLFNSIFSKLGFEVHGLGYLNQMSKNTLRNNPFEKQKQIFNNRKVKTIFDVGANRGGISIQYSNMFPDATVWSFEPIEQLNREFEDNTKDYNNIVLSNIALSDNVGTASFNINKSLDTSSLLKSTLIGASSDKGCETQNIIDVSTNTIDNFCTKSNLKSIEILKMDVQGAELDVLKGAEYLLKNKTIGLIYFESYFKEQYENQPLLYDIALFLKNYGYELEDIYNPYYNSKQLLWCDCIFLPSTI